MDRKDIRLSPDDEKEKVYDQIHALWLGGKVVTVKKHRSGFPAVTVDCEGNNILTDILSIEQWWGKQKQKEGRQMQ